MGTPTFIVGTGRCGSTMLSNMLREHPKVLSLSEFFIMVADGALSPKVVAEAFSPEPIDGRRFWDAVARRDSVYSFGLRQGITAPEWLYPCDAPGARFSRQTGVPAILLTTLPHLTDDHDALFEALEAEVTRWPPATAGEHYTRLFARLVQKFGKRQWIERSGGGLNIVGLLLPVFPQARFVHVVRDGRDAALSMQEHLAFRLYLIVRSLAEVLGVDPLQSSDRTHLDRAPPDLRPFLPQNFDVDAFRAFRTPLSLCAELWSQQIVSALPALLALPADRLLTLRYEDFFVDPRKQLDALAAFLGDEIADHDWSARCAATVRKPKSTWRDLPAEEARELTEACRPGFELLSKAGLHYDL
jgi:putative sulfotransferase